MNWTFHSKTYQADEYTKQLHHICIGHRVESSNQGVEDGYESWDDHRHVNVYVHDHAQGGACRETQQIPVYCNTPQLTSVMNQDSTVTSYPGLRGWLRTRRFLPSVQGWRSEPPSSLHKAAERGPALWRIHAIAWVWQRKAHLNDGIRRTHEARHFS